MRRQSRLTIRVSQNNANAAIIISSGFPYQLSNNRAVNPAITVKNKPHFISFARPAHITIAKIKYIKPKLSWSVSILPIEERQ